MSKRLFVGGLPYEMTDEKLQELFSECGRVEKVKVMFDRATGRSKGFGFIEMATDLEGNAAILKFDGSTLGTRHISVKEAKPAENRRREGGQNRGAKTDNRPREHRSSPDNGNGRREGGFGDQRGPRPGSFGEQRSPRPGGFGEQRGPRSNGFSKPAGSGGFGGSNNRSGYNKPGGNGGGRPPSNGGYSRPGDMVGPGKSIGRGGFRSGGPGGDSADWRSELGMGTNQRKDFRRTNRDHNREHGRRNDNDNFGNR